MEDYDIKGIVAKFEATVPPGDDAAAQAFFEEIFPNFPQELKEAFLREALISALEKSVNEMAEGRANESMA